MGFSDNKSDKTSYMFGGSFDPDAWRKTSSFDEEELPFECTRRDNSFTYSKKGECQYKIGQELIEFKPMNLDAKFSFTKKSLDIIIGLAPSRNNYLNEGWLSVTLFIYRNIPTILVTTGYFQVSGSIIIKNKENINIDEWLNSTDDSVNLVLVDDYKDYEVKEIRRIQLPMMKTIRKVLHEQAKCVDGEIENTLKILDLGFQKPWMIYYKDEECKYSQETSDEIQKGTYDVFHPQEKKAHEY